jgi:uncharacterized repeat protein (TIGR03803 family)
MIRIPGWQLLAVALLGLIALAPHASASRFQVLHAFKGGRDGKFPEAGLVRDEQTGNLFGTTFGELQENLGKHCPKSCGSNGSVFVISPAGAKAPSLPYSSLYQFKGGEDGAFPAAEMAVAGTELFGTTEYGGGTLCGGLGCGTVFQAAEAGNTPDQILFDFCTQANCSDGAFPRGGLISDGVNFYGTTLLGGAGNGFLCGSNLGGCGIVYSFATGATQPVILYNFCTKANCTDGAVPIGGLTSDSSGNLYGVTQFGGDHSAGTIYELTKDGDSWTERVLYSFCPDAGCPDGSVPEAGLLLDSTSGSFYGTTTFGGSGNNCPEGYPGCGVVFQLKPDGQGGFVEAVLHSFCSQDQSCDDGAFPQAPLEIDENGILYGTTLRGGGGSCVKETPGCGVLFSLSLGKGAWAEKILHAFGLIDHTDGAEPEGALLLDGGYIYGVTRIKGFRSGQNGTRFGTLYRYQYAHAPSRAQH